MVRAARALVTVPAWLKLLACAVATLTIATSANAHPLHTTFTDIDYSSKTGDVGVTIRVFADDFSAAIAKADGARVAAGVPGAASSSRYLNATFMMRDRNGRPIAFNLDRSWRTGDLLWIRLRGRAPHGLSGGTIQNTMLFGFFDDQVNVVKLKSDGQALSFLFTPGARPKTIH